MVVKFVPIVTLVWNGEKPRGITAKDLRLPVESDERQSSRLEPRVHVNVPTTTRSESDRVRSGDQHSNVVYFFPRP